MHPQQCFCGRALQKSPRLRVNRCTEKIRRRCVSDVELDRRVERRQFNQVRLAKIPSLHRRVTRKCLPAEIGKVLDRWNTEDSPRYPSHRTPPEHNPAYLHLRRLPAGIAGENGLLAIVQTMIRKVENF